VGLAFFSPFSCDKDISEMTLAESHTVIKAYFSKLEPAMKLFFMILQAQRPAQMCIDP
jgi:hypothetical protein